MTTSELHRLALSLLGAWAVFCCSAATQGAAVAESPRFVSGIKELRALSPQRASEALPVIVRGIVTRVTPYELFLQDGADAVFVWQEAGATALQPGDYVEIEGVTHSGHLFPIVRSSRIQVLGSRGLPEPRILSYADMATGRGDCQWVEVAGMVESVQKKSDGTSSLRLAYDGALLRVELGVLDQASATSLLGARIRLRGVVSGLKSPQRRLVEPVVVSSGTPGTFWIEQPGPEDPFAIPLRSTDTLGQPNHDTPAREMVRIAGVVTSQPSPQLVFVRDQAQSLEIRLAQPAQLAAGDRIDAVGFVAMGIIQPFLKNAIVRRVAAGPSPPPRRLADASRLLDFRNEAELIEVDAELRDISQNQSGYLLHLAESGQAFTVEVDASLVADRTLLPRVGSRLSLVGVCLIERTTPPDVNQVVSPASMRLLLRSLDELRVLARPPWWTQQRLLTLVAALGLFALGAIGWIWSLNRRVRAQTRIILNDARKRAVLEERSRIARELHDTVEQQLAGATILLDAIAAVVVEQPQRAREGLDTTRAMLRHSLHEAQQAVANLRNNDLFERPFESVVEDAVRERIVAAGIRVDFRRDGIWPELDSMVKQHLLRIVQEAVTNAVKHACANCITITLRGGTTGIEVQVADNGCGFDPQSPPRPGGGEFGLIGLRERAERIGAELLIHSAPQAGTTIAVKLKLPTAPSAR